VSKAEVGSGQGCYGPVVNAVRRYLPDLHREATESLMKARPNRQHQPDGSDRCIE
jgi:hypothetical protein